MIWPPDAADLFSDAWCLDPMDMIIDDGSVDPYRGYPYMEVPESLWARGA